ncbi:DUF7373 family lipoprotein [Tsukamurella tyrosinosolvens]|uniref:DUF7373 family lipoprotein n=1 Tax=Tsukamurella tyrosinosolvens TaxID=57704 RepID=UPI000DF6E6ED|nr:hypothetical protein [Tsukamurella tyrosinosolvens]RDB47751.1 hypothetical protein DVB87_11535 [Tsukamurella tyrosinosolvens]
MSRRSRTALSIAVAAALAAGCSSTVAGNAVPDPNDPVVKLDTGGISTEPRTVETSEGQQKVLASNILAQKALYAWDIDPTFVVLRSFGVRAVALASNLSDTVDEADSAALDRRGLLYGFVSGRTDDAAGEWDGLASAVLRMTDDAAARGALDDHRTRVGDAAEKIGDRSDIVVTRVAPSGSATATRYQAQAVAGAHLIVINAKAKDAGKARDRAIAAADRQRDLLAGFASPGGDRIASLPADKEGIVSRTVAPDALEQGTMTLEYGFREGRAPLHWDSEPIASARLFEDSGVDLTGVGRNYVYRAKDASAADRFADGAIKLVGTEEGATEFSIDGLPTATCRSYKVKVLLDMESRHTCYVTSGRYVSEYTDTQIARVKQVTSAGYLILRHA